MRMVTIVGKIDSRVLVYPLMRALSMSGLTGVITDDGAYRRLFNGKELIGSVSGVDISVCPRVNEKNLYSLAATRLSYDYILVVSSDFIPEETDGIIVCHGLDRSILGVSQVEDEDDFILPYMEREKAEKEAAEAAEAAKKEQGDKKSSKKKDNSQDDNAESTDSTNANTDIVTGDNSETGSNTSDSKEETEHERMVRLQEENPDKIIVPGDKVFKEVQIAYAAAPKKSDIIGISIKDGFMNYVYTAEEQKKIPILQNKDLNALIAKAAAEPLGIDIKELTLLFSKEEGVGAPVKGGKK